MAPRRLNVLVFTGKFPPSPFTSTGTSAESVRQCLYSLRRLLSADYAVTAVGDNALLKEPWPSTCALLVFPGGADLGYCRVFNGAGNRRIEDYVRRGGAYLGLCAGGYYGSARCEFEVGNPPLDVVGPRELAFFPSTCRGAAFRGFQYGSERGARAVRLRVNTALLDDASVPESFASYYNGGGVFVDAAADRSVHVLASYTDRLDVDGGSAAVVLCSVGDGNAILCGPHPEFAAVNLYPQPDIPGYADLINKLLADDASRVRFLRACLIKLGLQVSPQSASVPPLSHLHLSSSCNGSKVTDILGGWDDILIKEHGQDDVIRGEADTFLVRSRRRDSFSGDTLPELTIADDGHVDFSAVPKSIIAHEHDRPSPKSTPHFDHDFYYASLARFQAIEPDATDWGSVLLYGEVVTSTNSILEKSNSSLTSRLPTGFTFSASTQLAGRGRGTNAWIAPPGALMFSTVINHPGHLAVSRPPIFLQYIAAIAVVEAVQSLGTAYESLPVKLKWPNDIYALDPTKPASQRQYVKIGGVLSHCGYCDGQYQVVLGIGINATNPRPTTSLSDLLGAHTTAATAPLRLEVLLARILTRLEAVHAQFLRYGFSDDLEKRYYRHWLHTGQAVSLEAEGGVRARILGITRDWGMLRAEETDVEGRGTGKIWTLQSDENSFDFWKGLVRRKL
ncbi:hypothetical protein L249_2609 [Ophiocordyceps polyrhachis-furcata BCC 54312]|uniref:BPL/LPL catalytic domain-containing protein n=1 Tax=Ophiocordyceps polyrhachis-furcata BCC 54312 TaxID=1330021 RepID=A0A367LPM0_9HYPO|nr:hypothetical protein L249_2609 [Ophiocordyceps polyrhachis-furcata BCC 54312]